MKSTQFMTTYFKLEQIESLILFIVGLLALAGGFYFGWVRSSNLFYQGIAWPMLVIGLLQVGVGISVFLRSLIDYPRALMYFKQEPERLKTDELIRVKKLMNSYTVYKWVEAGLCMMGILLIIFMNSSSDFWMGIGTGLWMQSGILLVSDLFAEHRGARYIRKMEEVVQL